MTHTLISIEENIIDTIENMNVFDRTQLPTTVKINLLLASLNSKLSISHLVERHLINISKNSIPLVEVSFDKSMYTFSDMEQISFEGQNNYLKKLGRCSMSDISCFRDMNNYVSVMTRFILFNCSLRVNGICIGSYANKKNFSDEIITQYGITFGESILQEAPLEILDSMFPDSDSRLNIEINKATSKRKLELRELRNATREFNRERLREERKNKQLAQEEERKNKQLAQEEVLQGREMVSYRKAVDECPDDVLVKVNKTNASVIKQSIVSVWAYDNGLMISPDVNTPECFVNLINEQDCIRLSKSNCEIVNSSVLLSRKVSSINYHRFNIKFFDMFNRYMGTKTTKQVDDVIHALEQGIL